MKDTSNRKKENQAKNTSENQEIEKHSSIERGDSIQTHGCIDANQEFIRYENHPNILPLFERLGRFLTSLISSLKHEAK
jgi:hypothetical protein